jgi:hypothetical protein
MLLEAQELRYIWLWYSSNPISLLFYNNNPVNSLKNVENMVFPRGMMNILSLFRPKCHLLYLFQILSSGNISNYILADQTAKHEQPSLLIAYFQQHMYGGSWEELHSKFTDLHNYMYTTLLVLCMVANQRLVMNQALVGTIVLLNHMKRMEMVAVIGQSVFSLL